MSDVATISAELQAHQRQRAAVLKSRIMQANNMQAVVAGTLGYHSGMPEKDRKKKFAEAAAVVKAVAAGDESHHFAGFILASLRGIDAFNAIQSDLEKRMVKLAKRLPAAAWVTAPEQRGFGLLFLAVVVGECGDLSNYANPAKVWRRMGCAPWAFNGRTAMGATWKAGKEGKLPADQWAAFGYSPRRRSIAFLIGEGIVKQNTLKPAGGGEVANEADSAGAAPGPYRQRYDEAKAAAAESHPDWPPLRCHRHGMLLATKRLLRDLWCVWTNQPGGDSASATDTGRAAGLVEQVA